MTARRALAGAFALSVPVLLSGCFSPDSPATDSAATDAGTGSSSGVPWVESSTPESGTPTGTSGNPPITDTDSGAQDTDGQTTDGQATSTTGGGTTGDDESSSGAAVAVCGNGVVEGDEACDDGNGNELDACLASCELQYASGNDAPCSAALAEHCEYFAAQCRLLEDGLDSICYWAESTAQVQCDDSPGIWTVPESEYAIDHPEMAFPGDGVCITGAINLRCNPASNGVCAGAGATLCVRSLAPDGQSTTGPDICWWDINEVVCGASAGIWTASDSGFAQNHPNALPDGQAACITQVTNL